MNILELAILKKMVGGGSGTDNYNDLSNLPQINSETLAGNKTAENLGLQDALTFDSAPTEDSTNPVESGGVYNALAGKQDNLTFDDDPTENSTNPVKSGGVYSALAGKQDNLTFDGVYNASTNKAATESTVTNAIAGLDVSAFSVDADETISSISETDGKVSVTKQDIAIASNQVVAMTGYTKPSSAPATPAIQQGDTANLAIGKLEYKADVNQSNILYGINNGVKNICDYVNPLKINNCEIVDGEFKQITTDSKANLNFIASAVRSDGTTYALFIAAVITTNGEYSYEFNFPFDAAAIRIGHNGTTIDAKFDINTDHFVVGTTYVISINVLNCVQSSGVYRFNKIMICTKQLWDTIGHDFQPPALPNYDLTRLEAEDRASLAEIVDSGAKNQLNISNATFGDRSKVTFNSDGSVTGAITDDTRYWGWANSEFKFTLPAGSYVLYCVVTSGTNTNWGVALRKSDNSEVAVVNSYTGKDFVEFTLTSATEVGFMGKIFDRRLYTMLCTKAAFGVSQKFVPFGNDPFYQVPINHNMIYRGQNLGATLTDAQHTALSSGNFTDLYLGDYWTKTVTIPAGTYTGGDDEEVTVPAQTNITLKAVIADFDTFYAGYASTYAGINTHHAAVIVTGFINVVWNKTNSTAGGYVASLIHKWLVGSALPQIETWFGSAKVLSHQKLLTNAITGDAASGWAWSSQKISLLSENQMYGSKVWGGNKATNGGYEPGEAFKHLNVFNHIDANLLFGNRNIWLRDIASAGGAAGLNYGGYADYRGASYTGIAPAALILLS